MNAPSTVPRTTSDVYDIAMLAGGVTRVVDTAVVALLERGRLRADGSGRLQALGTAVHPVEAAVLELAGPQRTVDDLRRRALEDPRLTAVAGGLVARGLLRRNPVAGLSAGWPAHLRTAAGRRALQDWPALPGGGSSDVALGGPVRMADRALAETVFGRAAAPDRGRERRSSVLGGDAGTSWWAFGGSWGGDGGGCGGFDGGGGGGGGDGGGGGSC